MIHATPFLLFDGNCAEAMTFYRQCFSGDLTLIKLGDTPMKERFPAEKYDRIINARLVSGFVDITATDWMASPALEPKPGNMFSIYLVGDVYEELESLFSKLSQGADKETRTYMELHEQPFGMYGQFTDKYGVAWIFKGDRKP